MSRAHVRQRFAHPILALAILTGSAGVVANAQDLPPVGSTNVAIADPVVPAPLTTPCTVTLYDDQAFADFDPKPFLYIPPADCPGPWQKVVLGLDYSVTMGRQFDRTATVWLGGAILYFGTTQEPSATVSPSWHIDRDLTDYSPLFADAHDGRAILGNFVGNSGGVDYTGVIFGTAKLTFYPLAPTVPDHPPRPDVLLPLAGVPEGGTADLAGSDARLSVTFPGLPTNIERAFLDVYAQSQGGDEFWYFNLPDDIAPLFADGGGTAFRETQVYVDDQPAGVAPVYPWIYTGGADPLLWRPIPGVQTLAFEPYRVDLTPFAGLLSDGRDHTVSLGVFNAQDHFSTAANLMLYLDHGATQVTGTVTTNTLAAPEPVVESDVTTTEGGVSFGTVSVTADRAFSIAGTLVTSHGTVNTTVDQHITFSSVQRLSSTPDFYPYQQLSDQGTTVDSTTTRTGAAATSIVHETRNYPLSFYYSDAPGDGGGEYLSVFVSQGFERTLDVGYVGYPLRTATVSNHHSSTSARTFDVDGNNTRLESSATQSYVYRDPFGACYSRSISAQRDSLTEPAAVILASDGENCPAGTNELSWFDAFYNYGSSVTGATLQLLP